MYGIIIFKRVVSTSSVYSYKKGSSKKLLEFLAEMPKDKSVRVLDTQRQRVISAKKHENFGVSTIYLQVLGSGARGAPNTLYLFTDQKRYLFNCGEGTQRLAHEHKVRLSKLEHIFVTSKTWQNIGGLPGVSLTLQDVGIPSITLHGPEGLDELYNATRRFVILREMEVNMAKCSPSEDYSDSVMSVKYVLLGPDENVLENDPKPAAKKAKLDDNNIDKAFEEFIHDNTDYYNKELRQAEANKNKNQDNKQIKQKVKSPERDSMKSKTEQVLKNLQRKSHCTVAYICTFKKRYGTLDLAKCVERGVKPGPLLGKLKMGEDVVLPDGTLVFSKDVKTPDDPGPVVIVLEVPDISYLREAEFSAHFDNGVNPSERVPALVAHYTPPHVFHNPTYQAFITMFGPRARHLVLNEQNACLGSEAVHRTQHKLHLLDADIFPLLRDASVPAVWRAQPPRLDCGAERVKCLEELKNKIALAQFQNIISMEGSCGGDGAPDDERPQLLAARTLSIYHLRPKREFDRSAEPKLQIQDYIQEAMDVDGFATSLEQFRKLVDGMRYARNASHKEYPKVVFLGTGSCIPSKTRNTSAIVLHINENSSMLLDCGEGTFGQLVRFYGPKRVNAFLRTLKAIYISHLHADHHIGLIGVLQARRQALEELEGARSEPLQLLAPGQIVSWLATYDMQFEKIRAEFTLVPNQNLLAPTTDESTEAPSNTEAPSAMLAGIGVQNIRTCYVTHCPNAFGVAVDVDAQHKITYSGDTIPCEALVKIGKKSTLLIHEATMEDELADEARLKMHSTTSQAISIGRDMEAKFTVLTHFSQRYARLPRLSAHILHDNKRVGIAFDNMQITMGDLELLPHMYAPLQLMFAEHCVELELKAASRARRKLPPDENQKNQKKHAINTVTYRDSNASRLRQEIRRMVGNAPVKRNTRSKSCSSTKSANSATPRSHNSENTSPERKTAEKPLEVNTPRSTSQSSNIVKEAQERSKVASNVHVIDTRSRTLHSASATPSAVKVKDNVSDNKINSYKIDLNKQPSKESGVGYGKPLVTPLNKKLVIRRGYHLGSTSNADTEKYVPSIHRCKSPVKSWKAENRPSSSSVSSNKRELSKTKILKYPEVDVVTSILIHLILWRLFRVVSCLPYVQGQVVVTIVSVGVLFWTAARENVSGHTPRWSNAGPATPAKRPKSSVAANSSKPILTTQQRLNSGPRRASSADRKPQDTSSLTATNNTAYDRKARSWNSDPRSTKGTPRSQTPTGIKPHLQEATMKTPAKVKEPPDHIQLRNQKKHNPKETNKPIVNGKAKFANHSSKTFKPQLEDIKSSYLLLNKKPIDRNINEPGDDVKSGLGMHSYHFGRLTDYWLDIKVNQLTKDD
ncbi:ribonuclease Z, mitochondrial isoform X3 [Epargyreus clarus]|uniref:ribonuclease Z, mitochondrial isoform X3 n=1 Tax=Epargyreus clarus TaxID=520877 RepID=UPI003C3041F2